MILVNIIDRRGLSNKVCHEFLPKKSKSNAALTIHFTVKAFIGVSLSEPHHVGSTVKSVFLLACFLACSLDTSKSLYMAESHLSANQHYIKHYKHYIKQVEC